MVSNKNLSSRKGHRGDRGGEDDSSARSVAGGEHSPDGVDAAHCDQGHEGNAAERSDGDVLTEEWRAHGLPVEVLTAMRSWLSEDAAKRFPGVIAAVDPEGRLPQHERAWIAEQLIGARCSFELRTEAEAAALQPAQEIKRLRTMETAVATFFEALGIKTIPSQEGGLPAPLGMLLPDVVDVTAIDGPTVLRNSRIMLRTLWAVGKAAGRAADMAEYISPAHDHGGARQAGPRAAAELLYKLFWIYDGIRRRHPASGPETAWSDNRDGMPDFIKAFLTMIAPELEIGSIKDAFYTWRAFDARMRRERPDLNVLPPPEEPRLA